jgi:hypothetical protein
MKSLYDGEKLQPLATPSNTDTCLCIGIKPTSMQPVIVMLNEILLMLAEVLVCITQLVMNERVIRMKNYHLCLLYS